MCQSASFIVKRSLNRALWSKQGDSHSAILRENGIRDDSGSRSAGFCKVEIVPPGLNYALPFELWEFSFDDNGHAPDGARENKAEVEKLCRDSLPTWALCHFLTGPGPFTVTDGQTRFILSGSPIITQSGGVLSTCGTSSPTITQSGGVLSTYGTPRPTIAQSGGTLYTHNTSSPTITQSGGDLTTFHTSSPTITQAGHDLYTCDTSSPTITQSGGVLSTYDTSSPTIIRA